MSGEEVRHRLPDGSVAVVQPIGVNLSSVWREVEGVTVWGQSFGEREDHPGQVADVVRAMSDDPAAFARWWLS